jgi:hypothetical protein
MAVDSEPEPSGGGFLASVSHFDWLKIPGAVRAIAHVVTAAGDAGSAWLDVVKAKGQKKAQRVRDITSARSAIVKSLAKAGAQAVTNDAAIIERAVDHLVSDIIKKQVNLEAVAVETVHLIEEDPPNPETPGPSEDWLNVFSAHAEKASSETLRKHWARVLAGEIRVPGAFSLQTLQFLSIVDPKLAALITRVRPWIISDNFIPVLGLFSKGEHYTLLLQLDSAGFLRLGSAKYFDMTQPPHVTLLTVASKTMMLQGSEMLQFPAAVLTQVGSEMLPIIAAPADEEMIAHYAEELRKRNVTVQILG